jgi:hypothetical protein
VSVSRDSGKLLEVVKVGDEFAKLGGGQIGRKRHSMHSINE